MATKAQIIELEFDTQVATLQKTMAELELIHQQTIKTMKESQYHPASIIFNCMIGFSALMGAGIAIGKFLLN